MFFAGLYLVLREKNLEARQIRDEVPISRILGIFRVAFFSDFWNVFWWSIYNHANGPIFNACWIIIQ